MPLSGDAKRNWQREYMPKRRAAGDAGAGRDAVNYFDEPELGAASSAEPISLAELKATITTNPFESGMLDYLTSLYALLEYPVNSLLFCGGAPGIGKSFSLKRSCAAFGLQHGVDWMNIRPPNGFAFVKAIWKHRDMKLLVLNDHDTLLKDIMAQNVVKGGWGAPPRIIGLDTVEAMKAEAKRGNVRGGGGDDDDDIPPTSFPVTSKLVWLSNHNAIEIAGRDRTLAAILDRGFNIDIRGTQTDLFRYTMYRTIWEHIINESVPPPPGRDYSPEVKHAAVQWFNHFRNYLKKMSLRGMADVLAYVDVATKEDRAKILNRTMRLPTPKRDIPGFDPREKSIRSPRFKYPSHFRLAMKSATTASAFASCAPATLL